MDIEYIKKRILENSDLSRIFDKYYLTTLKHAKYWEETQIGYYKENFCLKKLSSAIRQPTITESLKRLIIFCKYKNLNITYDDLDDILQHMDIKSRCCLPKNHDGRCIKKLPLGNIIKNKSLLTQLSWVYSSPGNNDYIFKNRSSRIFPIKLSNEAESFLRDKTKKCKCVIPLKDSATPLMAVTCYIDIVSQLLNIDGIYDKIMIKTIKHKKIFNILKFYKKNHFQYLISYYFKKNRQISYKNKLACPVRGSIIKVNQLLLDIKDDLSIQFGHVNPRSSTEMATRGQNVLLMTRRGNLVLGDHEFLSDSWIQEIYGILKFNNIVIKRLSENINDNRRDSI